MKALFRKKSGPLKSINRPKINSYGPFRPNTALRGPPAVTRLTVYRRFQIRVQSGPVDKILETDADMKTDPLESNCFEFMHPFAPSVFFSTVDSSCETLGATRTSSYVLLRVVRPEDRPSINVENDFILNIFFGPQIRFSNRTAP